MGGIGLLVEVFEVLYQALPVFDGLLFPNLEPFRQIASLFYYLGLNVWLLLIIYLPHLLHFLPLFLPGFLDALSLLPDRHEIPESIQLLRIHTLFGIYLRNMECLFLFVVRLFGLGP